MRKATWNLSRPRRSPVTGLHDEIWWCYWRARRNVTSRFYVCLRIYVSRISDRLDIIPAISIERLGQLFRIRSPVIVPCIVKSAELESARVPQNSQATHFGFYRWSLNSADLNTTNLNAEYTVTKFLHFIRFAWSFQKFRNFAERQYFLGTSKNPATLLFHLEYHCDTNLSSWIS